MTGVRERQSLHPDQRMPGGMAGMATAPLWWHPRGSARLARQRVDDWFAEASCRTPIFRRHRQETRSKRN